MITSLSKLILGLCICLLVVVSVAGNLLVCLAIYKNSRLRRIENAFLASLAVADLLVAVLVMPFAGVNDLLGYWVFGSRLCSLWIAVDIMCSTASILSLCAVSLDRYIHIRDPFMYSSLVTKKVAVTAIIIVWVLSTMISVGFHWTCAQQFFPYNPQYSTCALGFSPVYAVISSSVSFFVPCLVMISIYCRLYFYARRHWKSISELCPRLSPARDHKTAVTIGVVMGIFMVCWLPFFCANILAGFCKTCVSAGAFKAFSWLGYSNSMFNPIVYTVLNSEFRDSFKLLLLRRLSSQASSSSS